MTEEELKKIIPVNISEQAMINVLKNKIEKIVVNFNKLEDKHLERKRWGNLYGNLLNIEIWLEELLKIGDENGK